MNIKLTEITVEELVKGYKDNYNEGVIGFGGRLDIRPPYQREFIYKDKQRDAVINTVRKNFPLNVMYWAVRDDGDFEIIDGQQRTISLCQYINGDFSFEQRYFHNLQDDEQKQILNYKLMVYVCSGEPSEKLEWFKIINIAGVKLTDQELRNAVYSGSWVTDAKRYFSKNGCIAYKIGNEYLTGLVNRQDYLETAINWISKGNINNYMAIHQNYTDAEDLWIYFNNVISWVKTTFPVYRNKMKEIDWGKLYNEFKDIHYNTDELEIEIQKLLDNDEVQTVKGIYLYILTKEEKYLNLRQFDDKTKTRVYEKQNGICPICKKEYKIKEMEADHIVPWNRGGKTIIENCQMLCQLDNRTKSGK